MGADTEILVEHIIGLNIIQRRYALDLQQQDLAAAVGLQLGEIRMIEAGLHPALARHLKVIADQLRCTVDDLYCLPQNLHYENSKKPKSVTS